MASVLKFDGSKAWTEAARMISTNRKVVIVVAGVFFFLPYLAVMLIAPDWTSPSGPGEPAQSPEQALQQFEAYGPRFLATMLVLGLIQAVGVLGLLRLLTDRSRPTVGEALGSGLAMLTPYVLAQVLQLLVFVGLIGLPASLLSMLGNANLDVIGRVAMVAGLVYLFVRFSLVSPVIAIERVRGPVQALRRSWRLTAGKTGQLLTFYALLFLALFIVLIVVSLILSLIFTLMGEHIAAIGNALVGSLTNAVLASVMMAVLAAVHRQLAPDIAR